MFNVECIRESGREDEWHCEDITLVDYNGFLILRNVTHEYEPLDRGMKQVDYLLIVLHLDKVGFVKVSRTEE